MWMAFSHSAEHTHILDFFVWGAKRALHLPITGEAFLALGKATALGFGCRLCHLAGQCFIPGLTGNQFLGSNTVSLLLLHFMISAPQVLFFTAALGRFIRRKCQRRALPMWETKALAVGRMEEKSGGQSSYWVSKTCQMCGCSYQRCSWDKTNGAAEDLHTQPARHSFKVHQKWQWQRAASLSPSPAAPGQPASLMHNSFLFEPDSKYGFSRELKSEIWPSLQIL